jgi:hypothetical protein
MLQSTSDFDPSHKVAESDSVIVGMESESQTEVNPSLALRTYAHAWSLTSASFYIAVASGSRKNASGELLKLDSRIVIEYHSIALSCIHGTKP